MTHRSSGTAGGVERGGVSPRVGHAYAIKNMMSPICMHNTLTISRARELIIFANDERESF